MDTATGDLLMGAKASKVGSLVIDLSNVELTGDAQRHLLRAVEETVVAQLAKSSAAQNTVTITLAPNNGNAPRTDDEGPDSDSPEKKESGEQEPEKEHVPGEEN